MGLERLDALAVGRHGPLALQPHHARLARAVDVGVEQADARAVRRQASARFTAAVDLPTPPLPDATAMTLLMPGQGLQAALDRLGRDAASSR